MLTSFEIANNWKSLKEPSVNGFDKHKLYVNRY